MWMPERVGSPRLQMMRRDLDDETLGRCEAQALGSTAVAADPYAAWLQQRESERMEERPAIRWVYRNQTTAGRSGGGWLRGPPGGSARPRPPAHGGRVARGQLGAPPPSPAPRAALPRTAPRPPRRPASPCVLPLGC